MDDTQPLPTVERTTELPASTEEIWEQIIDGALSVEWLGVTVEPRRGGRVVVPGKDTIGTVEEVDPGRSITWSWREPDGDPSQVTIDIEPGEKGTRLTITERMLEYTFEELPPQQVTRTRRSMFSLAA